MWKPFMRLLDQAGGDGGAGGGGAGGDAAAAAAAAAAAKGGGGAGGGGAPAGGSALAGGAGNASEWAPEKYHVKKADGTLDVEATARKLGGGYKELDTRMKDVGLPPESPDKYDFTALPAEVKPVIDEMTKDPGMQGFIKGAHALGFSNKQMNFVLAEYAKVGAQLAGGGQALTQEQATTELHSVWKSEADYNKNLGAAFRAGSAFAGLIGLKFEDLEKSGLANNPQFIRIMSAVGAEMSEDIPPNVEGGGGEAGKTFEEQTAGLRAELQKLSANDPKRKGVQDKLDALYARKYPSRQPMLSGRSA